ncbi:MAG: aldolase/citrate lyase family protein [Acidaminobacteraceae bacterium]
MMKLRRTMLYLPANNPGMLIDAKIYNADSIMIDLEDSIAFSEKDSARILAYNALKSLDYDDIEVVVRINGLDTEFGLKDIEAMVSARVDVIRLPKTETKKDIEDVEKEIEKIERIMGIEIGTTKMMAAIESPLGIVNAYEIATSSKRLIGIAIGAEDFVTNMKTTRSLGGIELLSARSQILIAARAAGIYAIDTVFSDIENTDGFIEELKHIKQLGFDGKSVIHPSQIELVNNVFRPSEEEVDNAQRTLIAVEEAEKIGLGVITVNGKMVDKPIIERAKRVIELSRN